MQFAVPQFTDAEDRLVGSLTLKQFLVLLATGGVVMLCWSIFGISFLFFILALPIGLAGIFAALGKYNGRPVFTYLVPLAGYVTANKLMVFKREPVMISVAKSAPKKIEKSPSPEDLEPAESRLKKLAYLMDQKSHQEREILDRDTENLITTNLASSGGKIDFKKVAAQIDKDFITPIKQQVSQQVSETRTSRTVVQKPKMIARPGSISNSTPVAEEEIQIPVEKKPKKFDPSSFFN